MELPIFQHLECSTRKHCEVCRSDRAWRRSLVEFYGGPVDFECVPLGLPIIGPVTDETLPPPAPHPAPRIPPTPEQQAAHAAAQAARVEAERVKYHFYPPPGDRLTAIFTRAGIVTLPGCSCKATAAEMNRRWAALEAELPDAALPKLTRVYLRRNAAWIASKLVEEAVRSKVVPNPLRLYRAIGDELRGKGK